MIVFQGESCPFSEEKLISFVRSPPLFHRYRIAGDATAAGAGAHAKIPKERNENVGLSISPEPVFNL